MIGVFDSGRGGINTLCELRRLIKYEDIALFCDKKSAPFGTKSREQIRDITERGINLLRERGARRVLIGCCTASTVYPMLSREAKEFSYPIITPIVTGALKMGDKISVIATEATVNAGFFKNEILKFSPLAQVYEISAQRLVESAERGECDGNISSVTSDCIEEIVKKIKQNKSEVLILGCTHFPSFKNEIKSRLGGVAVISSSEASAEGFKEQITEKRENKRLVYISS